MRSNLYNKAFPLDMYICNAIADQTSEPNWLNLLRKPWVPWGVALAKTN